MGSDFGLESECTLTTSASLHMRPHEFSKVCIIWSICSIAILHSVGAIRRLVDYLLVRVYKNGWSLPFSNNQIFILNPAFPTVPQYPCIF